jgi:hypothetical protein
MLRPQHESFAWYGWSAAIALLGLESMSGLVQKAFARGLIDPVFTNYDHFREDLGRTLADPERMAGLRYDKIGPLDDAIAELAGWYAFSDAAKQNRARHIAREAAGVQPRPPEAPAINPLKGVGRNDPCPCGSGKKFKKCCLPRAPSAGLS